MVAVQNPLTSLADDVAATKRIIALQDGPLILVGHSYAGVVITEAGNDPDVVGPLYVAAFAPGEGESINSVSKPYPPAPLGSELRPDAQGFPTATRKGIADDMAQDLPDREQQILMATQGQTAASVFGATVTKAAWKSKPSWALIADNDRAIPPELERDEAASIKATSITLSSNHLAMLSHPREVAELIEASSGKSEIAQINEGGAQPLAERFFPAYRDRAIVCIRSRCRLPTSHRLFGFDAGFIPRGSFFNFDFPIV